MIKNMKGKIFIFVFPIKITGIYILMIWCFENAKIDFSIPNLGKKVIIIVKSLLMILKSIE